jgi:hypothetical protein
VCAAARSSQRAVPPGRGSSSAKDEAPRYRSLRDISRGCAVSRGGSRLRTGFLEISPHEVVDHIGGERLDRHCASSPRVGSLEAGSNRADDRAGGVEEQRMVEVAEVAGVSVGVGGRRTDAVGSWRVRMLDRWAVGRGPWAAAGVLPKPPG